MHVFKLWLVAGIVSTGACVPLKKKDFAGVQKAQLKLNFICFDVVFCKNGRSANDNVTI